MSFDWLNVPGLNISNDAQTSVQGSSPPPTVSFSFDTSDHSEEAQHPKKTSVNQLRKVSHDDSLTVSGSTGNFQDTSSLKVAKTDATLHSQSESDIASTYVEPPQELQVPLAIPKYQLTPQERKAYLRWFNDLHTRIRSKQITLDDVFNFLANFKLDETIKERISRIFRTCRYALNEEQFFAVVRLAAHALQQRLLPTRSMILEKAPVLKPKSILSATAGQEVYEEVEEDPNNDADKKVDFDGFASLLLTGKTVRKNIRRRIMKRRDQIKKVRFSQNLVTFEDEPTTISDGTGTNSQQQGVTSQSDESTAPGANSSDDSSLDLSLPMEQLLLKLSSRNRNNSALVKELPSDSQPETQEEREVLEDMKDSLSHFRQIQKVDNVTQLPDEIPNSIKFPSPGNENQPLEPLKPTATGSANHLFRQTVPPTQQNIGAGSSILGNSNGLQPLKPTATGSANEIFKNIFRQNNNTSPQNQQAKPLESLKPTSTGSANYLMKQQFQDFQEFQPFQSAVPSRRQSQPLPQQHQLQQLQSQSLQPPQSQSNQPYLSPQQTAQQAQQAQQPQPPQQPQLQNHQQYLSPQPSNSAFQLQPQGSFMQPSSGALVSSPQPQLSSDGYFRSLMAGSPSLMQGSSPQPQNISNQSGMQPCYSQQPAEFHTTPYHPQQHRLSLPSQMPMGSNQPLTNISPQNTITNSDNILNDLKALQQQVDQLHQTYNYDVRR